MFWIYSSFSLILRGYYSGTLEVELFVVKVFKWGLHFVIKYDSPLMRCLHTTLSLTSNGGNIPKLYYLLAAQMYMCSLNAIFLNSRTWIWLLYPEPSFVIEYFGRDNVLPSSLWTIKHINIFPDTHGKLIFTVEFWSCLKENSDPTIKLTHKQQLCLLHFSLLTAQML